MIYLQDLSFAYSKTQHLFEELDLTLQQGNIYGLLGRNGAGKTTLLRLLAGLLFPQKGVCEVMGYRPQERRPVFLSELYFINEELYVPPIHIKTYEKLFGPFYPKFDVAQFYSYLEEFEIDTNQNLSKLSYGQKKKVLLSFGLATNCKLLILDEPTNGLDIPSKTQFRKIIARSISDTRSFIVSTHQVRDMTNLIDPIIILDEGKLLFNESLESISQKLFFELHSGLTEPTGVIYTERVPGGYLSVGKNTSGADSEIDLEILFNAVVNKKSIIKQLFQKEVQYDV